MSAFSFSLHDAPAPSVALEIAASHVSAANVQPRGTRATIAAHTKESLPEGALVPSLTAQNARERAAVTAAVRRVLEASGRPRRIALVVPDPVVKVSLVRFEHVPPRRQDFDQLVRWQVRKAAPFPIEEAQVSWVRGAQTAEGHEFIVSLAKRDIVREYEDVCAEAGAYAGIVDISTFNVVNAVLDASVPSTVDWLLVNVASDYTSIAILRGSDLIFFRSRSADAEGTLTDLVHQTAMYYEDRLSGNGFDRVLLSGASHGAQQPNQVDQIRRNIQDRLGKPVETVSARMAVDLTDRISGGAALVDSLAPLVGVLLRGREASA